MICEYCGEEILYEYTQYDDLKFCDKECLIEYILENTVVRNIDKMYEFNN